MSSVSSVSSSPYDSLLQGLQSVSVATSLSLDTSSIASSVSGMALPVDLIQLSAHALKATPQPATPADGTSDAASDNAATPDPSITPQAAALQAFLAKTYS